jgi:hypothetical protein
MLCWKFAALVSSPTLVPSCQTHNLFSTQKTKSFLLFDPKKHKLIRTANTTTRNNLTFRHLQNTCEKNKPKHHLEFQTSDESSSATSSNQTDLKSRTCQQTTTDFQTRCSPWLRQGGVWRWWWRVRCADGYLLREDAPRGSWPHREPWASSCVSPLIGRQHNQ